ncbi:MAG: acyl-CoA dehydrogenase family protein, partial [Deltaproteobacteria bacterium]|nr:acyl-CoA dehydrogenase family protein [Deltaproteobacteria bacterium]
MPQFWDFGVDYYGIEELVSEEEALVQAAVRRFVRDRVLPTIAKHFEEGVFPKGLIPELAELGILGGTLDINGGPTMSEVAYGLAMQELERGDSALRSFCL